VARRLKVSRTSVWRWKQAFAANRRSDRGKRSWRGGALRKAPRYLAPAAADRRREEAIGRSARSRRLGARICHRSVDAGARGQAHREDQLQAVFGIGCVAAHQEIELFLPAAERSREASAAAILHWKKKRRPTQKNGAREGRTIVFIDESGVSERPRRVRTFAPKGKTPVRQESFPWNQLSAIAGVTFWNISFKLVKGGVRAPVLRQVQERRLSQKSPPPSRPPQAPHHLGLRAHPSQPRRAG
jgi:hypothetical protein